MSVIIVTPDPQVTSPLKGLGLFPYAGITALNPIQTAVLEYLESDEHLMLAVPTGAGKTLAAELPAHRVLRAGGRIAYLSPLRAVSQERFDDWTAGKHPFSKFEVQITTGDYQLSQAQRTKLSQAQVLVLTAEMLDSLSRTRPEVLEGIEYLIVDEAQLLGSAGRGDALEAGLMRFTRLNRECRIAALSATVPNIEDVGAWFARLARRGVVIIRSDWRPTQLDVHFVRHPVVSGRDSYYETEQAKVDTALDIMSRHPQDKFLVFGHTRNSVRMLTDAIGATGKAVAMHHAGLDKATRLSVEAQFRGRGLDALVATSTLAQGINVPARRVIVAGVSRGRDRVSVGELLQMVGRAGRPGLDPRGDAYIVHPENEQWEGRPLVPEPVTSQLVGDAELRFHVVAEIHLGHTTPDSIVRWMNRSLARHLGARVLATEQEVVEFLAPLVKAGILKEAEDVYTTTALGRISTWLYFDPLRVAHWCSNWRRIAEADRTRDERAVAWMLADTVGWEGTFIRKEQQDAVQDHLYQTTSAGLRYWQRGSALIGAGLHARLEASDTLRDVQGQHLLDAPRWVKAVSLLDRQLVSSGEGPSYFSALEQRLRYNLPSWELADLCRLPGIGAVRAWKLSNAGFHSARQVLQAPIQARQVLGLKVHRQMLRVLRQVQQRKRREQPTT